MTKFNITTSNSIRTVGDFEHAFQNGSAGADSLVVRAGASIRAEGQSAFGALLDDSKPWTVQVDGTIASSQYDGLALPQQNEDFSHITVGAGGRIAGGVNGIYTQSAVLIRNEGRIEGSAGSGIEAFGEDTHRVVNDGAIIGNFSFQATGLSDDRIDNSGVMSGGILLGDGNDRLDNARRIVGGVSKDIVDLGAGDDTLVNSGTIALGVLTDTGQDVITNSGSIKTSVSLGGDDDVLINFAKTRDGKVTGTVTGEIDLGTGDDRLEGGAGAEDYGDGGGRDIANFRGGNDIYRALTPGDDGVDRLRGGDGIDTYDARPSTESVYINLDSVKHALPSGSAFLEIGAGRAKGIAVADQKSDRISGFENVFGGIESDVIYGSAKGNYIDGGDDRDELYGMGGDDHLVGGAQLDHLAGGAGQDMLTGGEGSDMFVFASLNDSGTSAAARDAITDFESGQDNIVLGGIDANAATSTDDAFDFIGTNVEFSGTAGELRASAKTAGLIIEGDVDGDTIADFSLAIADRAVVLQTSDFEL